MISTAIIGCFAALCAIELLSVLLLWHKLAKSHKSCPSDRTWPKVSIVTPLRGADPTLEASLRMYEQVDYPNFEVRLVIDSQKDPAWAVAQQVIAAMPSVSIHTEALRDRPRHRSLICSAIIQGIRSLPSDSEVIIFLDGDVALHPSILKDLVEPLDDPNVALAFGNRWYRPVAFTLGSAVRQLWNAAAIYPMWFAEIPWGGCMAVRKQDFFAAGGFEALEKSMVQDAPLMPLIKKHGKHLRFVPSLLIPNEELCSLGFCYSFITRQMLWTRLYHPYFLAILLQAIVIFGLLFVSISMSVWLAITNTLSSSTTLALSIAVYLIWTTVMLWIMELAVGRSIQRRGQSLTKIQPSVWLLMPLAIALTHAMYLGTIIRAATARTIQWRGIHYTLRGPFDIEMRNYEQFQTATNADSRQSL